MKKQLKKHWKIILGVFFIIGGIANFGSNNTAAVFGLILGVAFSLWWFFSFNKTNRKTKQFRESESSAHETGYTYVGSTDSNKYHRPSCPYAQKIPLKKQVWFKTKADAERHGYKPCEKCRIS